VKGGGGGGGQKFLTHHYFFLTYVLLVCIYFANTEKGIQFLLLDKQETFFLEADL